MELFDALLHMCPSLASVSVLCVLSRENDACICGWKTFHNILSVKRKLVGFTNFVYTVFNVSKSIIEDSNLWNLRQCHILFPPVCAWLGCGCGSVEKERS